MPKPGEITSTLVPGLRAGTGGPRGQYSAMRRSHMPGASCAIIVFGVKRASATRAASRSERPQPTKKSTTHRRMAILSTSGHDA
eukprot:scaffold6361_cov132-Isochrysis_galbana.AAC.1